VAAVGLLLSGCGGITRSVPVAMPSQLVGNWQAVTPDDAAPFPVRFAAHEATFGLGCGTVTGPWRARPGGLFVVVPRGLGGSCYQRGAELARTLPAWLLGSTSFAAHGSQRVLQDLNGTTTLTLTPDPRPTLPDPEPRGDRAIDDRRDLTTAPFSVALPAAHFGDLLGRWRDPNDQAGAAVAFRYDGSFTQHDGCNLQDGRWVAESGSFLAIEAVATLVSCARGTDLLDGVTSMAKAGPRLVLFDGFGHQLRELWYDGDV
jgi:hypothetical protein